MKTSFSADDRGSVQVDISVAQNYSESHSRVEHVNMQTIPRRTGTGHRFVNLVEPYTVKDINSNGLHNYINVIYAYESMGR